MAEDSQSATTPAPSIDKQSAVKDKKCPFCDQAFTSSSLGRHLDLFIKAKNPKPSDGLHDVAAIQRLRGPITRRQPRNSARRDRSTPSSARDSSSHYQRSPIVAQHTTNGNENDGESFRTFVNQANWQATGVINELPPTPRNPKPRGSLGSRRASPPKIPAKDSKRSKEDFLEVVDRARALELALREVLENYKVANSRAHPSTPFEFNFFGLSIPQMYLQCLASPPSLLIEPARHPHGLAWTLRPPSSDHYETLRSFLATKLTSWRRERQSAQFGNTNAAQANVPTDAETDLEDLILEEASYYEHLESAFNEWKEKTDAQRDREWQHECARAFAREREKHRETKRRLDATDQDLRRLRSRLDQAALDKYGLDANMIASQSLSRQAVSYLPTEDNFDYNNLVSKWQGRVQSARGAQRSLPSASFASEVPSFLSNGRSWEDCQGSYAALEEATNNSAMQDYEDDDLVDAPGEDDLDQISAPSQPLAHDKCLSKSRSQVLAMPEDRDTTMTHIAMELA